MKAKRLSPDGTIGIICTSHVADIKKYSRIVETLNRLGYKVKLGEDIYKDTYGFVASTEERADDINTLIEDDDVQMILFGGGESAAEILPLIDYNKIKKHPKLFSSYSDGTSILNAINVQTGLITYYGAGTGVFLDLRYYDYMQFCLNFVEGYSIDQFKKDSDWKTIRGGQCAGILIGGYLPCFGLMLSNRYFRYDQNKKYILFLEDHEKFSSVGAVSTCLAFIEQSAFMQSVSGVIFGHYSDSVPDELLHCFERFGSRNNIPVVYTDDFGHGTRHAVLPIGMNAELDADRQSLLFLDI